MQSSTDQLRLETLDLNFYHCYHNGWGPVATLNSFLRANAGHLRSLALRVTYDDSEGDVDDELRVTKPADGEVDLSCLPNLRSLYLSSHNVEAICSILKSAPPTLEVLEVDFTSWIYYEEAPCMCDPGVLVYDFAAVMKEDRFARLTSFDIRVPEFFGEQGKEMLKEYFPRWKNTNNILRVSYINSSFYQADSWQTVRELMFGVPEL
ncbi:hypothetical protein C8R44DRAFT_821749 [Mycena epipterygia]|nr:hypothetical protein C8R44DRAFT_821749 [Mycena epipterygia]